MKRPRLTPPPPPSPICLKLDRKELSNETKTRDSPESVGVEVHESVPHLLVLDEHVVRVLEDEVVHLARGRRPPHGVPEALRDLAGPLVPRGEHALVELRVEQLRAGVEAHGLREGTHLRSQAW